MVCKSDAPPSSSPAERVAAGAGSAAAVEESRDDFLLRQCEFYFSDANMPRDDHLLALAKGHGIFGGACRRSLG
jgi:hypothetical protein